jgi:hypothetical protein
VINSQRAVRMAIRFAMSLSAQAPPAPQQSTSLRQYRPSMDARVCGPFSVTPMEYYTRGITRARSAAYRTQSLSRPFAWPSCCIPSCATYLEDIASSLPGARMKWDHPAVGETHCSPRATPPGGRARRVLVWGRSQMPLVTMERLSAPLE